MNQVATKTALASSNLGQLTFGKVEEWKKRRETLASVLPDEEWSGIDNYFLFFEHMSSSMLTQAVDDEVKESLRTLLTKGRSSLAALRRYAGEKVRIIEKLDDSDEEQPDQ